MRHRKHGRQLGRDTKHRRILFRNLVTSLLEYERIETTLSKAKEVRIITDNMITLGKMSNLSARRRALAYIVKRNTVSKLFKDIAPRLSDRNGGYTRIIKTRIRQGDGARMAVIELTQLNIPQKTAKTETSKKDTLQK